MNPMTMQRRSQWSFRPWALGTLALLATATVAEADFINHQFGYTGVQLQGSTLDATLNVAVLDRTGGVAGDVWNTGSATLQGAFVTGIDSNFRDSPALDTGADYLFLYQVINNGVGADAVRRVLIKELRALMNANTGAPTTITSWGSFTDHGFRDSQGDIAAFANPRPIGNPLGALPEPPAIFDGMLRVNHTVDMEMPSVVMREDTYVEPGTVLLNFGAKGSLDVRWGVLNSVVNGQDSSLFGFTVRRGRIEMVPFDIEGPDIDEMPAKGRTLGVVPAPPSLVLALIGAAGLGFGRALRRSRKRGSGSG